MPMTYDHGLTEPAQLIGKRVEIPVHFDTWARGAKYGTCTAARNGKPGQSAYVLVKMDHPQIKRRVKLWRGDIPYTRVEI